MSAITPAVLVQGNAFLTIAVIKRQYDGGLGFRRPGQCGVTTTAHDKAIILADPPSPAFFIKQSH